MTPTGRLEVAAPREASGNVEQVEQVEVVVVGAGQAGVAMSEHLGVAGIDHVVFERSRIAEKWRTGRWDSLVANGPAWHDRFPALSFGLDPDDFATKDQVADYFEDYARQIDAPVRVGVEVTSVRRLEGRPGFRVETSHGPVDALYVVSATGAFQTPLIPPIVADVSGVRQRHSADYRNPGELPEGAVLVVGAGSSGVQIASELRASGRTVYLSVGRHDRPPRRYRGRDNVWWLGVLGKWAATTPPAGADHVTIAVSGAHGGHTIDFRDLAAQGIRLVGSTTGYGDGAVRFGDDLVQNIVRGDQNFLSVLREADAFVERNGLDLPEEPQAHRLGPVPEGLAESPRELHLESAGVTSIVWATGYRSDFGWLRLDVLDDAGRPRHRRGVSDEAGIYFLGLPWLSGRGSSFIWGVWHDAKYLADQIQIQRSYAAYGRP
jgi:putative flavoprotein involved in K+ transport